MPAVYNIPASDCFVETLAAKLLDDCRGRELDLAGILILLPNHRACRSLAEAFVRKKGMSPTLLPQMRAIGDVTEDELILSGQHADREFLALPPAVDPLERTLLFMRLIMSRYAEFGLERISLAQSCRLAAELGSLIDRASLQNLDWSNLASLAPEEYAVHWQETLKFLNIITAYWPDILAERGVIDAGDRKNRLIEAQCRIWQQNPPPQRIIIAGTTAVSPAMKLLVKTVLTLPRGEVYLAGLDTCLEEDAWEKIDETHPQFELKQLLDYLQINRSSVMPLVASKNPGREKLISEIMRPAVCSHRWRLLDGTLSAEAVDGIRLIECPDSRSEALTIAVLIRHVLQTPEKTVALITPDRSLARRTAAELRRWNINVDDSAGIPLAQTPWGIFMRLCIAAVAPDSGKEELLALFKNPLFSCGMNKKSAAGLAARLDKDVWRGGEQNADVDSFLHTVRSHAGDLIRLFQAGKAHLQEILTKHLMLAEAFAADDRQPGSALLWQNEDGEAGAAFMSGWLEHAAVLGDIETAEYLPLFETMMASVMVRSKRPSHHRVRILGPMEARLNHFDTVILGGVNEGIWPPAAAADPWMSRPMKRDFGFEQPEKQIGVLALDFANLLGAADVCLTRSCMTDGAPTVKSRWWMRLETVLQALNINKTVVEETEYQQLAAALDRSERQIKIAAPAPTPPLAARPRKLSASAFEKLLRDPYSVYAEYILRLKPLNELEPEAGAVDFGNMVHGILEKFGRNYPQNFPDNAEEILLQLGEEALSESGFAPEKQAFWRPKLNKMISWLVATEKQYRPDISQTHSEVWGSLFFDDLPGGKFEIYAKADRIDETRDGELNIIDYKTGRARSAKEVKTGYAPQLPIEGLIASSGGFNGINAAAVNSLIYWRLGDKVIQIDDDIAKLLDDTRKHLLKVINLFDFESTGYLSRPNPKNAPEYSDYEHLARVREWSVKEEEDD